MIVRMRWGLLSLLQTFVLDDDGTCANCGEDEGDHVGEGKRCPVFQSFQLTLQISRYVQETLITFPLILFALCLLCMRMIRFECLRHAGWIFMAHLLSRQWVSFPAKPLDLMQ